MKKVTLVTGGCRSGKSTQALRVAEQYKEKAFLATAQAYDKEMEERIRKHKEERQNQYLTIEEPIDIAAALKTLPESVEVIIVDCMTVWLSNLMFKDETIPDSFPEMEAFLALVENPPCHLVVVTNEVGMGIVPDNALSRDYRDRAGRLNQEIAKRADDVFLVVSGIPVKIK